MENTKHAEMDRAVDTLEEIADNIHRGYGFDCVEDLCQLNQWTNRYINIMEDKPEKKHVKRNFPKTILLLCAAITQSITNIAKNLDLSLPPEKTSPQITAMNQLSDLLEELVQNLKQYKK